MGRRMNFNSSALSFAQLGHRFADWTVGLYGHQDLGLAARIVKPAQTHSASPSNLPSCYEEQRQLVLPDNF